MLVKDDLDQHPASNIQHPLEMSDDKRPLHQLKTRPWERNVALTRMGVAAGANIAAHEFINLFRSAHSRDAASRKFYKEQAEKLADQLGRLKGSVMKVGQMLSLYGQYFLPPEAVDVLAGLQDNTPAVPWTSLAPVLQRALGKSRLAELDIDREALASASLGQVHRARRKSDGAELVLKIQYPGVADAIESDIATLSRLIAVTRIAPSGLDLSPVYAEVKEMLHREVDYLAEREHTERFGKLLADDPRYVVPRVYGEYCSDQVLALSYETGCHVKSDVVQKLSQERRNTLAEAALDLFLREFFEWGMVQTDPHFGNYRFRIDERGTRDRIVLLDFGATRVFGRGFIDSYREMVRGALARDRAMILRGIQGIGLVHDGFPEDVRSSLASLCELIVEPFAGVDYDYGASDLPRRVTAKIGRGALTRWFRIPPREIVFLHRRLAGVFILVATLRAHGDARPILLQRLGHGRAASALPAA